jgi:hypothetical protein
MKPFQLDQCANDRRLAGRCNAGGQCSVRRWPSELEGVEDHLWLPDMLTRDAPVLTWDFTIVFDGPNRQAIPTQNTGLIIIKPDRPTPGFGSKLAAPIIEKFKAAFPEWHETDWSNVYVEITETSVYVSNFLSESLSDGEMARLNDERFVEKLKAAIAKAKESVARKLVEC